MKLIKKKKEYYKIQITIKIRMLLKVWKELIQINMKGNNMLKYLIKIINSKFNKNKLFKIVIIKSKAKIIKWLELKVPYKNIKRQIFSFKMIMIIKISNNGRRKIQVILKWLNLKNYNQDNYIKEIKINNQQLNSKENRCFHPINYIMIIIIILFLKITIKT